MATYKYTKVAITQQKYIDMATYKTTNNSGF